MFHTSCYNFPMEDNIIPARSNPNPTEGNIIPPRSEKDQNSNEIGSESLIPARNQENQTVRNQNTEQKPVFVPKMGKIRFVIETSIVFLFFDLCPFLLTFIDLGGITIPIIEGLKWMIASCALATVFVRTLLLGIRFFGVKPSAKSIAKILIAPIIEMIPILNGFTPGWTVQYVILIAPVVFDLEKIIAKGGRVAKIISQIPGAKEVATTVAKTAVSK